MNKKKQGVAGAVCITVGVVLALAAYLAFYALSPLPLVLKLIIGAVILALCGVAIYVLIERIKEIRSGENDDLGKY